jgi:hypothetical protein
MVAKSVKFPDGKKVGQEKINTINRQDLFWLKSINNPLMNL